jgi:4-amino-4-deoxy-L-arabinose transferase-like glycosyltransferase
LEGQISMKTSCLFMGIRREPKILMLIVILALALNTIHLDREGYGNLYYAAGVKSMLLNWHNFFYLSYDPAGFISLDKPPLGFWLQAASAALFGFHGWALMLPQIIAGVLSVIMIYHLVHKTFGSTEGLIAALILAVTPISVAASRNNTIDSVLVLTVLLAAWMLHKAMEGHSSLAWTIAAAAMIGLGFNIKMLAAYLVLPAFILLILLTPRFNWTQKLKQLSWAAVILAIVSLSWAVIVDLTPVDQRPYIGSTAHNSVLELALQHNAMGRYNGIHNPLRLVTPYLGGQISWLLPLALLSAVLLLWKAPLLRPMRLNLQQRTVVFWSAWLLPMTLSFTTATLFHRYYTVMMAPGIAALAGVGMVKLWHISVQREKAGKLVFAALLATGAFAISIAWSFPEVRLSLSITIGGLTIVSLLAWVARFRMENFQFRAHLSKIASITGLLAVLSGPAVWAITPSVYGNSGSDPAAGPDLISRHTFNMHSKELENLTAFLQTQFNPGKYLVATPSAETSSPLILDTGLPVLTMGGYSGSDPILTSDQLQALVQRGRVKYFLLPLETETIKLPYVQWIQQHCQVVTSFSMRELRPALSLDPTKPNVFLYKYMG